MKDDFMAFLFGCMSFNPNTLKAGKSMTACPICQPKSRRSWKKYDCSLWRSTQTPPELKKE